MMLDRGGPLEVSAAAERTPVMRFQFRNSVQRSDGVRDTGPKARGLLSTPMREAGFAKVAETHGNPTPTGSISIYRGAANDDNGCSSQSSKSKVR